MIFWRTWIGLGGLMLLGNTSAVAHDPYEITATGSVLSNRFEISAVFEYRAARLLAGLGWPTNQINEPEEFQTLKPALENAAKTFFTMTADGQTNPVTAVAAALGVENHVTFIVTFTGANGPLTIAAPGLAPLAPEGQYGVGFTMLDMIRKKVLGQHVFSAANPQASATFAPATETGVQEVHAVVPSPTNPAMAATDKKPVAESSASVSRPTLWPWFLAAALGAVGLWLAGRRR